MHPHNVPDLPWMFTAADIFEWHGKMHLVLVDSFSGWFELDHLPDMRSVTVIAKLKRHFAVHGTPQTLLTDNARQFVCSDFSDFARAWDFEHIQSSPRYPQSNGLAERAVRSAKHLLEKCYRERNDIQAALLHLRNLSRAEPMECAEEDYSPLSSASPPTTPLSSAVLPSQSEASTTGTVAQTTRPIVTRSGRVSRPNPRYLDYTTG